MGAASALAALAPVPVLARGAVFDMEQVSVTPDGVRVQQGAGGDMLTVTTAMDPYFQYAKLKSFTRQDANDFQHFYPGLVTLGTGLSGKVVVGDFMDATACPQKWTITLNQGALFQVKSLAVQEAMTAGQELTLQWYLGNAFLGGYTVNLAANQATVFEPPAGYSWPEVDKVVITGGTNQLSSCQWGDFWVGLDNLELQAIKNAMHDVLLTSYQRGWPEGIAMVNNQPNGNTTLPTTLPAPVAGYVFDHWNTAQDGSGSRHAPGSVFLLTQDHPQSLTLHARWLRTQTLNVLSFSAPSLVPGGTARASAAASSGLAVVFGTTTPAVCEISGDTVRGLASGSCVVTADQAGDGEWAAASRQSGVIEVGLASQVIGAVTVHPSPLTVGGAATASATASSGLPVAFGTTTPAVCEVSGSVVRGLAPGTCVVTADQAGNGAYAAASRQSAAIEVGLVAQSIGAFTVLPAPLAIGAQATASATASSGLPVAFGTATPGICDVQGNQVRGMAAGVCVVTADQAGGGGYAPAPPQSLSLAVNKLAQSITLANPGDRDIGALVPVVASASSGLPVGLTATPPAVCAMAGATQVQLVGVGACTVQADQGGDATYAPAASQSVAFNAKAVLPGAPVPGVPVPGDRQALVSFSAPADTGGASIDRYRVTVQPSGASVEGNSSPITVTGLTNGTAYTFTVSAHNSVGYGPESAATAAVTPKAAQTITFTAPGPLGLGMQLRLVVAASSGLPVALTSQTPATCEVLAPDQVRALAVGACTIQAEQAGDAAHAAAPAQTISFPIQAVVPGAPGITGVTGGAGQASVGFAPPVSDGGGAIDHFRVTVQPGGRTVVGAGSPITVTGLSNGSSYTFTVSAHNSAGYGPESAATAAVTPKVAQTITFTAPGPLGLGLQLRLVVAASSGLPVALTSQTPATCEVLAPDQVRALAVGACTIQAEQAGDAAHAAAPAQTISFPIQAVVPGAPGITGVSGGKGQASVGFALPVSDGGGAIDHFRVTVQPGGRTVVGAGSPITVTGLSNGSSYTFTVSAHNSAGYGPESPASGSVTPAVTKTFAGTTPSGLRVDVRMSGGGNDCAFLSPGFVDAALAGVAAPPGMLLRHGLFQYTLVDCDATPVTLVLDYSAPPGAAYWKYGPTRDKPQAHWYAMPGASVSGHTVTFTVQDGGAGDDDLVVNGRIVDPGGPVVMAAAAAVAVPSLGDAGRVALAALLCLAVFWRGRRPHGAR